MGIKHKSNEVLFDKWSPKMAYLLGYIYADGTIINDTKYRGKYISATSIDIEQILLAKEILGSEHNIVKLRPLFANGKTLYRLRIGSKCIYDSLYKIGLRQNKSLTVLWPKIPKGMLSHFIRGYFDGDGCVNIEKRNGKFKRLQTSFTSGSYKFLEGLENQLRDALNLSYHKIYNSHRSFQLRYSTNDSLKLFRFIYSKTSEHMFLRRKFDVFNNYFEIKGLIIGKKHKLY